MIPLRRSAIHAERFSYIGVLSYVRKKQRCHREKSRRHRLVKYYNGPEGIRTLGLCVANAALSQLSYEPISQKNPRKMEATGLEPMTFRV